MSHVPCLMSPASCLFTRLHLRRSRGWRKPCDNWIMFWFIQLLIQGLLDSIRGEAKDGENHVTIESSSDSYSYSPMSPVPCPLSPVSCPMSPVPCLMSIYATPSEAKPRMEKTMWRLNHLLIPACTVSRTYSFKYNCVTNNGKWRTTSRLQLLLTVENNYTFKILWSW